MIIYSGRLIIFNMKHIHKIIIKIKLIKKKRKKSHSYKLTQKIKKYKRSITKLNRKIDSAVNDKKYRAPGERKLSIHSTNFPRIPRYESIFYLF